MRQKSTQPVRGIAVSSRAMPTTLATGWDEGRMRRLMANTFHGVPEKRRLCPCGRSGSKAGRSVCRRQLASASARGDDGARTTTRAEHRHADGAGGRGGNGRADRFNLSPRRVAALSLRRDLQDGGVAIGSSTRGSWKTKDRSSRCKALARRPSRLMMPHHAAAHHLRSICHCPPHWCPYCRGCAAIPGLAAGHRFGELGKRRHRPSGSNSLVRGLLQAASAM